MLDGSASVRGIGLRHDLLLAADGERGVVQLVVVQVVLGYGLELVVLENAGCLHLVLLLLLRNRV